MERSLMKGNEALAEAAIRAGCKCFFGYPITPQTELSAYMAKRMEKYGADAVVAEGMESGGHIGEQTTMTLVPQVVDAVSIPVIASGGAGTLEHFYDALTEGGADAALAASLFHYKELEISQVKDYLSDRGISVRR